MIFAVLEDWYHHIVLTHSCKLVSVFTYLHNLARRWTFHRRAVAQPCVNGDRVSKGKMAKFDPAQIRNSSTDRHKIWNRWLSRRDDHPYKISCKSVHWGLLGKWVKYNENFSLIYIYIYTFFVDRPTGQTGRRIFTHDNSNDAVSRKGVPFRVENLKLISNPWKIRPKSKIGQKRTEIYGQKRSCIKISPINGH